MGREAQASLTARATHNGTHKGQDSTGVSKPPVATRRAASGSAPTSHATPTHALSLSLTHGVPAKRRIAFNTWEEGWGVRRGNAAMLNDQGAGQHARASLSLAGLGASTQAQGISQPDSAAAWGGPSAQVARWISMGRVRPPAHACAPMQSTMACRESSSRPDGPGQLTCATVSGEAWRAPPQPLAAHAPRAQRCACRWPWCAAAGAWWWCSCS